MTPHPGQEILALHSGGDLPWLRRWSVERHLRSCAQCRAELEVFENTALTLQEELPELDGFATWDALAAEMRANIRLGLEASEAIAAYDHPAPATCWYGKWSGVLAAALVMVVFGLAWWFGVSARQLEAPAVAVHQPVMVEATGWGVEVMDGDLRMELRTPASRDAIVTVSTEGAAQTRYTDAETGQITVNHVYMD